jgi:hypothetical protein
VDGFRRGDAVEVTCLCRWVKVLAVFLVWEEPVFEVVRCVVPVSAGCGCCVFTVVANSSGCSDVGGPGSSDVSGCGGYGSLSLAGSGSCSIDPVDSDVCSISADCESVCRVGGPVVDSSDVFGDVGSGADCGRRGDGDEITGYRAIVVPAAILAAAYQRPGGERRPSTSRRAAPPRTTNRAPRRPTTVIFRQYVKFA